MARGTGGSGAGGTIAKSATKKKTSNTKRASLGSRPAAYTPEEYSSKYNKKLNTALKGVTNFKYNPLQDASYQALAKVYGARGNIAAKDTLADAAALNGGMQTSYAVSAAQQARNQYNQELAALVPELEQNAFNRAQVTYNALRDADDTAYGRFRDTEADRQWKFGVDYDAYRDAVADTQWGQQFAYQKQRDLVADQQWAKEYALSKKGSSGGGSGGGGRRSSGGSSGGGYSESTTSSNDSYPVATNPNIEAAQERGKKMTEYYKKQTKKKATSGGGTNSNPTRRVLTTR